MVLTDATTKAEYKAVKKLYMTAFPPEERQPFFVLKRRAMQKKGKLLIAKDKGIFVGFVYLIYYKDLIYIFFLAIDRNMRGHGYGSKILEQVKAENRGKRIFLAREPLDEKADNNAQRISRRNFYIQNGFEDLSINIVEKNYVYDAMSVGGDVAEEEYEELITDWAGKYIRKLIKL